MKYKEYKIIYETFDNKTTTGTFFAEEENDAIKLVKDFENFKKLINIKRIVN